MAYATMTYEESSWAYEAWEDNLSCCRSCEQDPYTEWNFPGEASDVLGLLISLTHDDIEEYELRESCEPGACRH